MSRNIACMIINVSEVTVTEQSLLYSSLYCCRGYRYRGSAPYLPELPGERIRECICCLIANLMSKSYITGSNGEMHVPWN
ncbi:MAG: hypothetical protein MUF37_06410 [Methanoregulaceae archaeon]|nr:hypothetical protein [Methanoregulaceae archaeon]